MYSPLLLIGGVFVAAHSLTVSWLELVTESSYFWEINTMLEELKKNWKWFVLGYSLVCLWILLSVIFKTNISPEKTMIYWPLTLACGGIGGVLAILRSLFAQWVNKKEFELYYIVYCFLHPIIGVVAGLLVYLIFIGVNGFGLLDNFPSQFVVGIPMVLSWLVGFQQDQYDWVSRISKIFVQS